MTHFPKFGDNALNALQIGPVPPHAEGPMAHRGPGLFGQDRGGDDHVFRLPIKETVEGSSFSQRKRKMKKAVASLVAVDWI